jgi:DNA polymerase elongation subunit (family B)
LVQHGRQLRLATTRLGLAKVEPAYCAGNYYYNLHCRDCERLSMSYVDVLHDRDKDVLHVVERVDGNRVYTDYPARYVFYYGDPKGKFTTIFNTPCTRVITRTWKDFQKERRIASDKKLFESDINPIFRCLEDNYLDKEAPKLHTCFFDIEVDFDPERGFSSSADAFMPITAITAHLGWTGTTVTLAVPPKTLTVERAQALVTEFDNTFIFEREADMLDTFLDLIEDADVLTGWNSEGYDIPYTVNRIAKVLSKDDTRRLCLWNQFPKKREYEKFGNKQFTYDLVGRVHADYLELYRKYTYEERHSYRLDAIGEYELGEKKTQYEGTLDQLYNKDFKKFIEYNRQDVHLLVKMDAKLQFLDLSNVIAHQNSVLIPTTMGAVATTEQAIINECHRRGLIVPSRKARTEDQQTQAAGAYVAYPKKGIHEWIGAIDINSLYPSAIRALNMGPETIIGQLRPSMTQALIEGRMKEKKSFAESWEGEFGAREFEAVHNRDAGVELVIDWETGISEHYSAAEVWKLIFDSNKPWILSANGTLFTYETEGIIPGLLARWYSERKEMQKKAKGAETDADKEYWDKRQLVRKIQLNSLYGAILNPGCRFFDIRIGQSTTLTGRQVAKHMAGTINEVLTGVKDHTGETIIYGDTDSCYFSAYTTLKDRIDSGEITWNKETVVKLYDNIAEEVNSSFPQFMYDTFHVPLDRGGVIKGGRELVASAGLFITKKRYAVLIYDLEGKRMDINGKLGKIKAMGLDLKRSDTPEFIQNFLSEVLEKTLTGSKEDQVLKHIEEFRNHFRQLPAWQKGTPKRVNNLTKFREAEDRQGKANMPGHVRASLNWNTLKKMHGDKYSLQIMDGQKVIVCKVKSNPLNFTSVAYPVDEMSLPQWFKELPFAENEMEETLIDNKLENLIGVLGWQTKVSYAAESFNNFFDFE